MELTCVECGGPVTATFAARTKGLCPHCKLRRTRSDPFYLLSISLIKRACGSADGFESLSEAEKLYYVLTLFQNEVYNGGFHQFFFNSSGSYYGLIESGLVTFDEPRTLELLHRAKEIVFPGTAVPQDTETRRNQLPFVEPGSPGPQWALELDEIGRQYYSIPDTLTPKLRIFAREKGLVSE